MNEYNSESIKILSDIEHIRQRFGMYIGTNDTPIHILTECIDNAIDEVECGNSEGRKVTFELHVNNFDNGDKLYTVIDTGRGIPTGYKEVNGKNLTILEAITTKSNSGGKFDNSAYLSSNGLNGLGMCIINALSDEMTVISTHNHITGELHCVDGIPQNKVEYKNEQNKNDGTLVSFLLKKDNKYFDTNEISLDVIIDKLNVYKAFGIDGIKLFYNNKDVTEECLTAVNPFDLHKHPMDNGNNALEIDVSVEASNKERFRFAFNYISGSSTSYKFNGYVNFLTCPQGGHIMAMQDALVKAFDIFCEKRNISKPSTMASDYFIGLNAIGHCNIIEKAFASQTKEKLITGTGSTRNYFNELVDLLAEEINKQFDKHVGVVKAIVQRIADYRKEREARKELKGLSQYITINQSTDNTVRRGSVYEKLTECTSKNRDECELIITEGDSASGGLIRTRDKKTVAILPTKGKLKNVVGCSISDILKNKEIAGIISSVGTGILDKCNVDRIRYKNILYAGDADADGYHITNLIIALFVNLMPEVVKQGKLKLIVSPLYIYKDKNNEWQGVDKFEDMPKTVRDKSMWTRIKGLGELNDDQVKEFLLNKEKRHLVTIEYPSDIDEFNNIMGTSEGKRGLLTGLGLLQE